MSETVAVPSQSAAALQTPPVSTKASATIPKKRARTGISDGNTATSLEKPTCKISKDNGAAKPKQSKSRNGCVTCKAKRLKCDETKPTCDNCKRRNVACGGYKKDYKWRTFEEQSFAPKVVHSNPGRSSTSSTMDAGSESPSASETSPASGQNISISLYTQPSNNIPIPASTGSLSSGSTHSSLENQSSTSGSFDMFQHQIFSNTQPYPPLPDRGNPIDIPHALNLQEDPTQDFYTTQRKFSGRSPSLSELLLPGTDLSNGIPVTDEFTRQVDSFDQNLPTSVKIGLDAVKEDPDDDEDVEEIPRDLEINVANSASGHWQSPLMFVENELAQQANVLTDPSLLMFKEPQFLLGSPEMLTARFDRNTCGIMSIRDGPTENPWRTLIWPLAQNSPALFHAIASMSSFHAAKHIPALRMHGIHHMQNSINQLRMGMGKVRAETALATTIALAFSESWDQHISTGIDHIKGARALVSKALVDSQYPLMSREAQRLRFLCKTWIYIDVIARLTSVDDDVGHDFEDVSALVTDPVHPDYDIDPLMGCASSLFPIVGRVANLVRQVCRIKANSPAIISQAMELKMALEQWRAPPYLETPEDPSVNANHSRYTAESYRLATMLYLHQAVPEIPMPSSAELAQKTLECLATVPISSRTVIVQIYPLLAAACEATTQEDRGWVQQRWEGMIRRMCIGNIDRCADVVKEVWARRDEFKLRMQADKASMSSSLSPFSDGNAKMLNGVQNWSNFGNSGSPVGGVMGNGAMFMDNSGGLGPFDNPADNDITVRSRLHWVCVMREWGWEVLLG